MIPIRYNLRSLAVRRTTSLMTALAVGITVMILLLLSGFVEGMRSAIKGAAGRGNYLIIQRGMNTEGGFIPRAKLGDIRSRAEIATDGDGAPRISLEFVRGFNPTTTEKRRQFGLIRGVYFADARRVHGDFKLLHGHWPEHGQYQMIVGQAFAQRFPNLTPPHHFRLGGRDFEIVGTFSDAGSARESEAWTDLDTLLQAFHITTPGVSAIHVAIKPGELETFKSGLGANGTLLVDVLSEEKYYQDLTSFTDQLRSLGLVVAVMLGIGSVFGGMNTMYAAVARRGREVGVLRVLGFGRGSILVSFLLESVILGVLGGIFGFVITVAVEMLFGLNSGVLTVYTLFFTFRLTPAALAAGMATAIVIGALGGFLPALRATRIEVIDSIREA